MRSRPVPTDGTGEPSVERVDKSRERHARGRSRGGSGPCGRLSGVDDEHPRLSLAPGWRQRFCTPSADVQPPSPAPSLPSYYDF